MKMRLPATPLITVDPYFSVWMEDSPFRATVHWTGKPNSIWGRAWIDGAEYNFLGENPGEEKIPDMEYLGAEADAFTTTLRYRAAGARLAVSFTSPLLADDLYLASRPVVYCRVSYGSEDGAEHSVRVRFTCSEELALNLKGESRVVTRYVAAPGLAAVRMGNGEQKVLGREGDDIRIDWGWFYLAAKGGGKVGDGVRGGMSSVWAEKELSPDALFLFAYDDISSILYFGYPAPAYWKKGERTITDVLLEAAEDYPAVKRRCDGFSRKLRAEATAAGGEEYAELLLLAYRQVMAAHKLVTDENGEPVYISKECFSNGCAGTVDIIYPSSPMFLKYNPELLKAMIRPVMRFAESPAWEFDFAPHDVGRYPVVDGQRYYPGKIEGQMPVEESGNMLILLGAICDADGGAGFALPYLPTLRRWCDYLIKYGEDPGSQLCTDDFAGRLPHNVNLSIKAAMGIYGFSKILRYAGEGDEADKLEERTRSLAKSILARTADEAGGTRLAYDKPGTFSLKYNAVWDRVWGARLFPEEFYAGECARYKKETLPYGVPLDSRKTYTKSDWELWAAAMFADKREFRRIVKLVWSAYNTTHDRVPMCDWYYADTAGAVGFRNRSVQGALFMRLLIKRDGAEE